MKKKLSGFYFYLCITSTTILWGTYLYRLTIEEGYYSSPLNTVTILIAVLSIILFIILPIKRLRNYGDFLISFRPYRLKFICHAFLSLLIFIIFIWATLFSTNFYLIHGGILCLVYPQILNMNASYHSPTIITTKGILQGFFFSSWDKFHSCDFKNCEATISATLNRSDVKHNYKFKIIENQKKELKLLIDKNTNLEVI